jgi:hypothetical protein
VSLLVKNYVLDVNMDSSMTVLEIMSAYHSGSNAKARKIVKEKAQTAKATGIVRATISAGTPDINNTTIIFMILQCSINISGKYMGFLTFSTAHL